MDTPKVDLLRRSMTAYQWRMQATASNVANIDTPGYRRLNVEFEELLQEARRFDDDVSQVDARIELTDETPLLEDELMDLADTQMRTQFASRALNIHFQQMRTAITGRTM